MIITDCSQSPIFSWDHLDIPRLTVTGILKFKCTEGADIGDYSSGGGGKKRPHPLSSFDTLARWKPVTQSARSRWSYGKIEDCEQSICKPIFATHAEITSIHKSVQQSLFVEGEQQAVVLTNLGQSIYFLPV